jgi:hypothetical protein
MALTILSARPGTESQRLGTNAGRMGFANNPPFISTATRVAATYTFDVFCSLDGYGSYGPDGDWGGYWGKDGPELVTHRYAQFDQEQRMVFVRRLKQGSDVPLRSHGSLSMNWSLVAAGLVDRLQVTVFPVITGTNGTDPVLRGAGDLELLESSTLDSPTLELVYRPTRH